MKSSRTCRLAGLFALSFTFSLALVSLGAEDRISWDFAARAEFSCLGATTYDPFRVDGQTVLSGKVTFPAFRGSGFFFDTNFLSLGLETRLSSDTFVIASRIALQPIQPVIIEAGGSVGTGWTVGAGAGRLVGLALNPSNDAIPVQEIPWGGFVERLWVSARLQLSAEQFTLSPWLRIYLEAEPRLEYQRLTAAGTGEAWLWQGDDGMNFNGFTFKPSLFVGYRPPIMYGPDDIGLGVEMETWLFDVAASSPAGSGGWGSDLLLPTFVFRVHWSIDAWSKISMRAFIPPFIEWTPASANLHRYFGNRAYSGTNYAFGLTVAYTYEY
ncbi:MAG: hypothetical protein ABSG63_09240 [Spirochaetia bacterium]|jgi:hypothetical protein